MRGLCFALFSFLPLLSFAQATPVVVADICPGGCSSDPSNLVEWNGKVYFFATSPTAGRELHVYDGMSTGIVADISPGAGDGIHNSSSLVLLNGKLYFAANDTLGSTRHYVYSYDGMNAPQKIALINGQALRSRGALAASGSDLLMEYNDSANRYRLAKYMPASGAVHIVSTSLYNGVYLGFGSLQANGNFAAYSGQLYSNSAKLFVCNLTTGDVIGTPTSHVGRATFSSDGVYATFSDITNVDPGAPGAGGTHLSRFRYMPFSWSMLTSGAANATIPFADRSAPAMHNGQLYYLGTTTPGLGGTPPLSLVRYDAATNSAINVASMPTAAFSPLSIMGMTASMNGILYLNYTSSADGAELFAFTANNIVRVTDEGGASAGFNPTSILSYNGDLLIAGSTSASGTELYRITGNGLGLTNAQQASSAILSPNPASTQLTITLPTSASRTLRILSTTGQTVRTHTFQGATATISVEGLASGLYFAQLTDAATGAPAGTARFVKE